MLTTRPLRNVAGLILACSSLNATAAPGDIDTAFATDGKFHIPFGTQGGAAAEGVIVRADGKIYLGGHAWNDTTGYDDFALVRLNEDGTLDTTFDTDGKALFPIGSYNDSVFATAHLPSDDSFVLAGSSGSSNFQTSQFAVAVFNSDGTLDTGFNTTGKATVSIVDNSRNDANAVTILSDGKVLVAGGAYFGSSARIGLARFNANGTLDTTFDTDGKLVIDPGAFSQATGVQVQESDGKIVICGTLYNGNNDDFLVARYTESGAPDTTFGGDGIVTTNVNGWDRGNALVIQSDGKIVVGGTSSNGTDDDYILVRYNTDGTLDTTFGGDGIVTTDFGSDDGIAALRIDDQGRIVASGSANNSTDADFGAARYLEDGTLDTTFGTAGKIKIPFGTSNDTIQGMAIQDDGKLLLAGEIQASPVGEFALMRIIGEPEVIAEPTRKADVILGSGTPLATGNNVYNLTGKKQTESVRITSGKTRTVSVGIQNDGSAADSFKLKGTGGNKDFSIKYLLGDKDVTDAVTAGKFKTGDLDPGEVLKLKAKIKAKTTKAGKEKAFGILATSLAKTTIQDKAVIEATSKAAK